MTSGLKYSLARIGLFLVVAVPLALVYPGLNLLIVLMIALLVSAVLSFVLPPLRRWRDDVANHIASNATRRTAEKERLRSALAGEDPPSSSSSASSSSSDSASDG